MDYLLASPSRPRCARRVPGVRLPPRPDDPGRPSAAGPGRRHRGPRGGRRPGHGRVRRYGAPGCDARPDHAPSR
jgi:hypothetical protein